MPFKHSDVDTQQCSTKPSQPNVDVESVLSKLTLEEKISLLSAVDWWRTPVIDRPGVFVPHLKTTDGPNGARGESYVSGIKAACFPCATSLGATFSTDLAYKTGLEVAKEAKTKSAHILLAPTLNVIRSPLGGRNYETYSEDPTILGELAAAYVNGCQSTGIAATPKHFVGNEAEDRRKTLTVEVDEQTLRELYLYPFQLVMKNSAPICFMTSYNRVNGTYVADNPRLIEEVLRKEWGFSGLVMSDWMGTYSTAECINAGMDLEMPGPTKWRGRLLMDAVEEGSVSQETITLSSRRVLQLLKTLGCFEHPDEPAERAVQNASRDEFIRDLAAEGMVLLKNKGAVLPIQQGGSVAMIGHLAKVTSLGGGGSARVDSLHAVTPLEGLQAAGVKVTYSPGVPVFGALPHADPKIVSKTGSDSGPGAEHAPVKLEFFNGHSIGERLANSEMKVNAEYMIKEAWPAYLTQDHCSRLTFDVTPYTSGNHVLSVIATGPAKCYVDGVLVFERQQETDLKMESFYFYKSKLERRFEHPMTAGKRYTLMLETWNTHPDLLAAPPLFGNMFQGASLRFFEELNIKSAIASAAQDAARSNYAVVCVGNTNEIESEGYDREDMELPGAQYDLIRAVAAANPNTIVVNFSGAPVTMTSFVDEVPGVLQAWFPGQECGHSLARVLLGHTNPSGHLPLSWPKRLEDNPSYDNFPVDANDELHYEEGLDVGYRFYDRKSTPDPLFEFGFGLSYTTFVISDAKTSSETMSGGVDGNVEVSCLVKNTGTRSGKVAVQFYVQMPPTAIGRARPVKELKAFVKIALEAGEEKQVSTILDRHSISIYDAEVASWRALRGMHRVHVGVSSRNVHTQTSFKVCDGFLWTGV